MPQTHVLTDQYCDRLFGLTVMVDHDDNATLLNQEGESICSGTLESCATHRLELLRERFAPQRHAPRPTLGGKQLWADIFIHCGWRIQEHVYLRSTRLLDAQDRQHAQGTWADVRTTYEQIRLEEGHTPGSQDAVVMLHGLIRAKDSMRRLEHACQQAGFEVLNLNYPSTRRAIAEHAAQLNQALNNSRGIQSVSFVTHSMGAMVVRRALAEQAPWQQRLTLRRHLMIFPPNQGSRKADRWQPNPVARWVMGPALTELTTSSAPRVPAPRYPFAVIAGARDKTVRPLEAGFNGADDFILLDVEHSFGMNSPEVINAAICYLKTGRLTPNGG